MSDSHEAGDWEVAEPGADDAEGAWKLRPLLLALLGLATGFGVYLIFERPIYLVQEMPILRLAEAAMLTVSAGLIGFTIERRRWWASLIFALLAGTVAAAVIYWNGAPNAWSAGEGWRTVSLFLAIAIATPLFQAARDSDELRVPYSSVHDHSWTNIVLWCACWAFVVIVFALAWLLAALFGLIKIDFLRHLLEKEWFGMVLTGLAFGSALGLLREHAAVVRMLQRVVATVLAVLAPVLAVGLILFVGALPFTGLHALWDANIPTTVVLLACVVGALILANAVIGDTREHELRFVLLRFGAMGLALVILPLAVIAAIATGLRIGQHGFTPERLWALTFVTLACAYGLAYVVSLVRGRMEWAEKVRPANLLLASGTCLIALLLATPLIDFNAISTADQVARLEAGKIAPDAFDWRALRFEFGEPGRAALARLHASADPAIREHALAAENSASRWDLDATDEAAKARKELPSHLRLLPAGSALPPELADMIVDQRTCAGNDHCTLYFAPGGAETILFVDDCYAAPASTVTTGTGTSIQVTVPAMDCVGGTRFMLSAGKWVQPSKAELTSAEQAAASDAYKSGKIEIRAVPRRQLFVGGVPVGDPFD